MRIPYLHPVEELLVHMILDSRLEASIDQSTAHLIIRREKESLEDQRTRLMGEWARNLAKNSSNFSKAVV